MGPRRDEDGEGGSGLGAAKKVEEGEHLKPMVDAGLYEEFSAEQQAIDRAVEEQAKSD